MSLNFANQNYLGWLNDAEVNKYLEVPKQNHLNDLVHYVEQCVKSKILFWAIIKKQDSKHIGNIKIDPINTKHGYAEYGILMGDKTEWGKGYAKEASRAVIKYCFDVLQLRKINLGVIEEHTAAYSLYKSLDFVTEGIYKKHIKLESNYCDVIRMAVFNKSINYN